MGVLCVLMGSVVQASGADRMAGDQPFALVELFTSQGCSSCPAADRYLKDLTTLARQKNIRIFTIGFHVDYWDYLGWRDPYASPQFTARQQRYAQVFRASTIYTPQMIVNGTEAFGGSRRDQGQKAIDAALRAAAPAQLTLVSAQRQKGNLQVEYRVSGYGPKDRLNIALVERNISTDVRRGENSGKILQHENSVRQFKTVPISANEGVVSIALPNQIDLMKSSLIGYIQNETNMQITGANIFDLGLTLPEN